MTRICDEVQVHLPALVGGTLPPWRRRLVQAHLRRCHACRNAHSRQQQIATGLAQLGVTAPDHQLPPDWLLDTLLDQADQPGVRGRVAGPTRGAVSGARPGLSALLLVGGAIAGTAAGYGAVRVARAVRSRLPGH